MRKPATIAIALSITVLVGAAATASLAGGGGRGTERPAGGAAPGGAGHGAPGMGDAVPPCGHTVTSGTDPDGTVGFAPCPGDGSPPAITPQIVEPTPGMADVYARPFDDAIVGVDGTTVTIDFTSGVEPCYVLDHVDVVDGTDAVTITLFEGHDPSAGQVACIEIGVFKRTIVTLDRPLDGRRIVDGAVRADQPA